MNEEKPSRKLLEALLLIVLMTTLGVAVNSFIIYVFVSPAIYTIFSIRNGNQAGLISIVATGFLIALLGNIEIGIFLLVIGLPLTYVYINLILKRVKSSEVMLVTSILFFLLLLLMIKLMELANLDFITSLEEGFNRAISSQLDMYKGMGLTSLEMTERKDFLEASYKFALLIIPAIMLIFSLVVSYLNYVFIAIGLERFQLRLANRPQLAKFRLPNNFILVTGLILLASLLMGNLDSPMLETSFINIQVLIGFAFTIQGLSLIEHFLVKKKIKLWIRTLSYFLFIFVTPIISLLPILGIADLVFDFKRIKKPKA